MRAQLLVLRQTVGPSLAAKADHAWATLSRACHQHPYEFAPTATELGRWVETARDLDTEVRRRLETRRLKA
jgi:hypothetical protein